MSSSLIALNSAKTALAQCKSLDDILEIRDKAEAIRTYAKASGDSLELVNRAAEIKLTAERKAGELLSTMDKQQGGRPAKTPNTLLGVSLGDVGVTYMQSSRWQKLAGVSDDDFRSFVQNCNSNKHELTQNGLLKLAKKQEQKARDEESKSKVGFYKAGKFISGRIQDLEAEEKFGTIYVDPPWQYGNQGTRASTDSHYGTMTVDEICEMPVQRLIADDAHLHLWTTNSFLFEAKRVIDAWGFTYKSCFVWVKPQIGIGNYWRVSHEFLLLGVKGNAKSFAVHDMPSWAELPRSEHSSKPEEIRKMIKAASPGPYLEIFGRSEVDDWIVFGNVGEKGLVAV